jgi:hypothetical protein
VTCGGAASGDVTGGGAAGGGATGGGAAGAEEVVQEDREMVPVDECHSTQETRDSNVRDREVV